MGLASEGALRGGGGDSDRFARVDAASQQARLPYWTQTLATLDAIPFDQLSADEKINAQTCCTSIRELASHVKWIYETPYEDMGRLSYETWRASELATATGQQR